MKKYEITFTDAKEQIGREYGISANGYFADVEYKGKDYKVTFITDYINSEEVHSLVHDGMSIEEAIANSVDEDGRIIIEELDEDGDEVEVPLDVFIELSGILADEYNEVKSQQLGHEVDYFTYQIEHHNQEDDGYHD